MSRAGQGLTQCQDLSYLVAVTTDEKVGEAVHQEMWRSRISQTKLATVLGISQSALSK